VSTSPTQSTPRCKTSGDMEQNAETQDSWLKVQRPLTIVKRSLPVMSGSPPRIPGRNHSVGTACHPHAGPQVRLPKH
jgi:hypothetical protein